MYENKKGDHQRAFLILISTIKGSFVQWVLCVLYWTIPTKSIHLACKEISLQIFLLSKDNVNLLKGEREEMKT